MYHSSLCQPSATEKANMNIINTESKVPTLHLKYEQMGICTCGAALAALAAPGCIHQRKRSLGDILSHHQAHKFPGWNIALAWNLLSHVHHVPNIALSHELSKVERFCWSSPSAPLPQQDQWQPVNLKKFGDACLQR